MPLSKRRAAGAARPRRAAVRGAGQAQWQRIDQRGHERTQGGDDGARARRRAGSVRERG